MQTKAGVAIAGILIAAAVLAAALLEFGASDGTSPRLVGEVRNFALAEEPRIAPAEAWHDASGAAVSLGDFRGKVVLLNFWASWCAPCLEELPSIAALQAKLGGGDFAVIALNIDRGGAAEARPVLERLKLDRLGLHLDPDARLARELGVANIPTTLLYDAAGREIGRQQGAVEWDSRSARDLIGFFVSHPDYLAR